MQNIADNLHSRSYNALSCSHEKRPLSLCDQTHILQKKQKDVGAEIWHCIYEGLSFFFFNFPPYIFLLLFFKPSLTNEQCTFPCVATRHFQPRCSFVVAVSGRDKQFFCLANSILGKRDKSTWQGMPPHEHHKERERKKKHYIQIKIIHIKMKRAPHVDACVKKYV